MAPSPTLPPGYAELRASCAWDRIGGTALLRLRGGEALEWLQGQVTQDVKGLEPGQVRLANLCTPTGQLEAFLRIARTDHGLWLLTKAPQAMEERAEKMVILEDVLCELDHRVVVTLQGPDADKVLAERLPLPEGDCGQAEWRDTPVLLVRADRCGQRGWDVAIDAVHAPELMSGIAPATQQALELAELEAGFPLFGVDTTPKTLPPELGQFWVDLSISYTKGCYTGQEIIHRIYSQGHTNRTWMGLKLAGPVEVQSNLHSSARDDAGVVTRVGWTPEMGWIGAAMVRREALEEGVTLWGEHEGAKVDAQAVPMPLRKS